MGLFEDKLNMGLYCHFQKLETIMVISVVVGIYSFNAQILKRLTGNKVGSRSFSTGWAPPMTNGGFLCANDSDKLSVILDGENVVVVVVVMLFEDMTAQKEHTISSRDNNTINCRISLMVLLYC